jgi:hypothetical protein
MDVREDRRKGERRQDYVSADIGKELYKIQEENLIQFKKIDEEIETIKNDVTSLRHHLDNGWKNDLVTRVIEATLNIKRDSRRGFWDWVKVAFSAAFFIGILELIKFLAQR